VRPQACDGRGLWRAPVTCLECQFPALVLYAPSNLVPPLPISPPSMAHKLEAEYHPVAMAVQTPNSVRLWSLGEQNDKSGPGGGGGRGNLRQRFQATAHRE